MKLAPTALVCVVCLALGLRAEIPPGWSVNYTNTMAAAAGSGKPALVFFTASWCGPCKMMVRGTLSDPLVQQALSNTAQVAIDIDENHDLASQFNIEAVPTFVMCSASGSELERTTGFQAPADFLHWLTNGISDARAAAIHQLAVQKQFEDIDSLLISADSNDLHRAAAALFDLCAEHDERTVQLAAGRLKTLAAKQPSLVLDGLDNPQLAARIQIANILHARFGGQFDVDPWSEPADRAKGIQKWRAKLNERPGE